MYGYANANSGHILQQQRQPDLADLGQLTRWQDADSLFTALGNGNTVGAIPYFLGGGASITSSVTGFGSDQIVSARLISAKGDLVDVAEETHPDLLWAIRGAGQFFGLVTQLVIDAKPLSVLGNDKGVIWAGIFVFPLDRAEEVCSTMKALMDDNRYETSGLMMVMAPPPVRQPSLVISARLTGDPEDAQEAFKPLYDLQPIVANGAEVPIQNASDARAAMGAKGDFKRFGVVGLRRFEADSFMKTISLWKEMVAECPDAINTAFNFQWDSRPVKPPRFDSAMSHHDIRYWQYVHTFKSRACSRNNLIWHTDPRSRSKVVTRSGQNLADLVDFQNGTRAGPIEHRYRGTERLARLRKLKQAWDPTGVFTDQLLPY